MNIPSGEQSPLADIDASIAAAAKEQLAHAQALGRVLEGIKTVAHDTFSLILIEQNPQLRAEINVDELRETLERNRNTLTNYVEAAVTSNTDVLLAEHQIDAARDNLLIGISNDEGLRPKFES